MEDALSFSGCVPCEFVECYKNNYIIIIVLDQLYYCCIMG